MTTFDRSLAGDVHLFRLSAERAHADDVSILERSGRNARTLVKDGVLRVTLIVLAPGGDMAEHQAVGPITVHVLDGSLRFSAEGKEYDLEAGDLLAVGAGIRHAVASPDGATFLLTIGAAPGATHRAEG